MTIDDVKSQIASGKKVHDVVLEAIKRAENDKYNAVLSVIKERALRRADSIDQDIEAGKPLGRLAGIPFLAKDNILTLDSRTTASAHILEDFRAPFQATAIDRLEVEGAICIGKTNLDAFAHGGSTENSYFGPTSNIADAERVAGGSSGGSAVAVAAGIVPFALGTDTGGSIRQPASYNGVVGYKPTYGSVSRYGVIAMASSTDVVGPISTTVPDALLVFDCMKGVDPKDSTTIEVNLEVSAKPDKLSIGVIEESLGEGVDPEVKHIIETSLKKARDMGHKIDYVSLPSLSYALAVYYIVVPAELTSNLARYDGIKYGHQAKGATSLHHLYAKTRTEGFMDENKRRILIGNYVLSSGYYDAYYKKAQTVRTLIINEFNKAFEQYDTLVGPVAPTPAFRLGDNVDDPLQMYLADIMTVPANLAGLPAISIPAGLTSSGLPVGLQIMGKMKNDAGVLGAARLWS